jgi:hypothetical protein
VHGVHKLKEVRTKVESQLFVIDNLEHWVESIHISELLQSHLVTSNVQVGT